ncbi:MAG: hypothetical protein EOO77_31780 [Oxalobacteraceae bacterium]|nr:MAG: hypothetical protein EOO77_31780 [Oxalobacteraceae bacterium]
MSATEKILYTGKTHTTGGRDGSSISSDRHLEVKLSSPGSSGNGTNPEQLFAAGWSACFIGAMGIAAAKQQIKLPSDLSASHDLLHALLEVSFLCRALSCAGRCTRPTSRLGYSYRPSLRAAQPGRPADAGFAGPAARNFPHAVPQHAGNRHFRLLPRHVSVGAVGRVRYQVSL